MKNETIVKKQQQQDCIIRLGSLTFIHAFYTDWVSDFVSNKAVHAMQSPAILMTEKKTSQVRFISSYKGKSHQTARWQTMANMDIITSIMCILNNSKLLMSAFRTKSKTLCSAKNLVNIYSYLGCITIFKHQLLSV